MFELGLFFASFAAGAASSLTILRNYTVKFSVSFFGGLQCEILPPENED